VQILKPSYTIINPKDKASAIVMCKDIERTARTCYKTEDKITEDSYEAFLRMLLGRTHLAMIEHSMMSVRFICDRGVTHEMVRHRLCAFAQESTRYCNYTKGKFGGHIQIIHPEGLTEAQYARREDHFWAVQRLYEAEIAEGLSPNIARGVLPTCLKTEIVITANWREWRHIFHMRTPVTAHPQMRELMIPLLADVKALIPIIFDDLTVE
jgi:thymidylate synthase (FAD)